MTIFAVNILEIQAARGFEEKFEERLRALVAGLKDSPGCFSYEVVASSRKARVWLVTGCWSSEQAMLVHFSSVEFSSMIWSFGCSASSIRFTSLLKEDTEVGNGPQ